jgi:hypothetical protein
MRTAVIAILMALLSQATAFAQSADSRSFPVLAAPGGRYVLGQISSFRRDQFLLDTQTGRVWTSVNAGTSDKENIVWVPMQFVANDTPVPGFSFTPVEPVVTPPAQRR